jgi:hypothetical protein
MKTFLTFYIALLSTIAYAQPYSGTIFIDPDIITSSDPSAIQSTTYAGRNWAWVFDRRTNNWGWIYAYSFNVVWDDGITSVAQVNPEFGSTSAAMVQAQKYAFHIGQLPACLRVDVDEIWIHKGTQPFGGGNNSILIHTGQSAVYESSGILEETLVHEATHTSLDAAHAASSGWLNAQNQDNSYISTYAQSNPTTEDVAESFLTWLAVRYRRPVISYYDYITIASTIPNRLSYFDAQNFNLYPFHSNSFSKAAVSATNVYPNPARDVLHIQGDDFTPNQVRIYNLLGQDLTNQTTYSNQQLNISNLPAGYYILKTDTFTKRICKIGGDAPSATAY